MHLLLLGELSPTSAFALGADMMISRARDVAEASAQLRSGSFDAVVLMPGLGSTGDASQRLVAAGAQAPVVAYCANEDEARRALAAGVHETIVSALQDPVELINHVRRAQLRHARQQACEQRWDAVAAVSRTRLFHLLAEGIAHEVNNPLAILQGNLEVLGEYVDELTQELGPIATSLPTEGAGSSTAILDDLPGLIAETDVALRRIRDKTFLLQRVGRRRLECERTVDINEIITDVVGLIGSVLGPAVQVTCTLAPLPRVETDLAAFSHVLVTLLERAARLAGDSRALSMHLETKSRGSAVVIALSVLGEKEEQRVASRRLGQLLRGQHDGGEDLELIALRRIIEQLEGALTLSTSLTGVSKLELSLRASMTEESAQREQPAAQGPRMVRRLLFIDDEPTLLRTYRRLFRHSYDVSLAGDGLAALELLAEDDAFDVVICDLKMPNCDGVEFYDQVSQLLPHLAQRIVFVAGEITSTRHLEFRGRIGNPFLQKPVPSEALREAIASVTQGPAEKGQRPEGLADLSTKRTCC